MYKQKSKILNSSEKKRHMKKDTKKICLRALKTEHQNEALKKKKAKKRVECTENKNEFMTKMNFVESVEPAA